MSECDCIKGYTGFVLKKEVVVCGKCGKTAVEAALQAENAKLKTKLEAAVKESITLYNLGYKSGHHDTVEGGYTDLLWDDMETYHEEEVKELISTLREKGE